MALKYADSSTREFVTEDGADRLVLKSEPTGSQYDERKGMLGNLRIPGNVINNNTNMEELFANGEMVEVMVEAKALAEFQFKSLFVSMTAGGQNFSKVADALGAYRRFDRESKAWIDKCVDGVWKAHEEAVEETVKAEGESGALPSASSEGNAHLSVVSPDTTNPSEG
jgi:hypothetical protein